VIFAIDVNADDVHDAADFTHRIMSDPSSMPPVLHVFDHNGNCKTIDLAGVAMFSKITVGFVSQEFRKQDNGKYICTWQDFIAGDDVQYENATGEPIKAPDHEYQQFNMTLVSGSLIGHRISGVLNSLDVGGEQSRQFASEIEILGKLLKDLGSEPRD
jgi:hypothetical protein